MATILPPNTPLLEKALDAATLRILDIETNLRALWSPSDCPEAHLPWLAWALSLDNWSTDWPAGVKRQRIRQAIAIARRKGTAESVRTVVQSFGGGVAIREWWQQDPPGPPHTFSLLMTLSGAGGQAVTQEFIDAVIAEVHRTKPVRSHFTFSQGLTGEASLGLFAVARPVIYARLNGMLSSDIFTLTISMAGRLSLSDISNAPPWFEAADFELRLSGAAPILMRWQGDDWRCDVMPSGAGTGTILQGDNTATVMAFISKTLPEGGGILSAINGAPLLSAIDGTVLTSAMEN